MVLGLLLRRHGELVHHAYVRMLLWVDHVIHLRRIAIHHITGTCIEEVLLRGHVLRPVFLHTPVFVPELRLALGHLQRRSHIGRQGGEPTPAELTIVNVPRGLVVIHAVLIAALGLEHR